MIVLRDQQTLILTPGKCGSTSLHAAFPVQIIGPQGPWRSVGHLGYQDAIGKHSMVVPYDYLRWRKLVVVRERESHVRSLWGHWQQHCGPIGFDDFKAARQELRASGDLSAWFYWWDVADYLADAPTQCETVPLANLGQKVRELTGVELPRLNGSGSHR